MGPLVALWHAHKAALELGARCAMLAASSASGEISMIKFLFGEKYMTSTKYMSSTSKQGE